jgi:hypothetical protein
MLDVLLILIALAAAAAHASVGSIVDIGRSWMLGYRQNQAGEVVSALLAALLGSISGRGRPALAAAWARPTPAARGQGVSLPPPYGAPPAGAPGLALSRLRLRARV